MIALLAAVPGETVLIREAIEDSGRESVNGMVMLTGRIHGHDVCLTHGGVGKAAAAWRSATWPSPTRRFSATRGLPRPAALLILPP